MKRKIPSSSSTPQNRTSSKQTTIGNSYQTLIILATDSRTTGKLRSVTLLTTMTSFLHSSDQHLIYISAYHRRFP
ncbi:hypothetical protein BDV40DRAFT_280792 [Aspergillus tamarii]|uniref:Uncharacterized protein n=1 Tax=Aspergillus tamarii TaxID=41984 RepID=A0A5N6UAM4_ASPTM|nr:hypothetical protein BDV40DRAFT_283241 [Aspergillus tamarii]KAE8156571.1 hypothetical protein BDV40DRAFT_280792 [Aspergillus tamarii]